MTSKIGIALSVYNKIDFLETNINIIRNHWQNNQKYFISVCCNDPESFERVRSLDIDAFSYGQYEIPSSPKPYRRLRIFDCIRNSILNCDAEYIIHYHADAFALNTEPINKIIDKMKENDYAVSYRGKGIDYRNPKNICGDVDDHFLIFKRQALLDSKIFNVDYNVLLKFLHVGNPETLLSKLIDDSIDRSKIYHYSDMFENEQGANTPDSFYSDNVMHRAMNPYNFDNERKFLHFGNVEKSFIQENLIARGIDASLIQVQ